MHSTAELCALSRNEAPSLAQSSNKYKRKTHESRGVERGALEPTPFYRWSAIASRIAWMPPSISSSEQA